MSSVCLIGYGQTGPKSHTPGYDSIASAVSGMMHITGPEVRKANLDTILFRFKFGMFCEQRLYSQQAGLGALGASYCGTTDMAY